MIYFYISIAFLSSLYFLFDGLPIAERSATYLYWATSLKSRAPWATRISIYGREDLGMSVNCAGVTKVALPKQFRKEDLSMSVNRTIIFKKKSKSIQWYQIDQMSWSQCRKHWNRSNVAESNGIWLNVERSRDVVPHTAILGRKLKNVTCSEQRWFLA